MKKTILFIVFTILCSIEFMAQRKIQGTVTDQTGELLPGVSVSVRNSTNGTSTDFDGKFMLQNVKDSDVLIFRYLGYEIKEVPVKNKSTFNIGLKPTTQQLDEVVIVGYGTANKKELTSAISSIKTEELENTATTNFDQALAGRVAGVQVSANDGTPGAALNIVIRGGNSITGDNSPLFVVDGIPLEDFDPASISTDDIESFDILKDVSATAIYGSRGANGIIIITTKSGRKDGKSSVNLRVSNSIQFIPKKLEVLNPYQYVKYQEGIALALDEYQPGIITDQFYNVWGDPEIYRNIEGTNWQDEIFRQSSIDQYNFNFSGGNENTSLYYSSEYLDQEGTLINTGFKKIINNLRIDHKLSDKTKFIGQIQYSFSNRLGLRVSEDRFSSVIRDAILFRPVEPINVDGLLPGGIDPNDPNQQFFFNPVKNLENTDRQEKRDVIRGNANIIHKFSNQLTLNARANYQIDSRKQSTFFGEDTQQGTRGVNGINGTVIQRRYQTLSTSNTLQYSNKFKKHRVKGLLGFEMQDRKVEYSRFQNTQLPTDIFGIDKLDIGTSPSIPETSLTGNRLLSYFSRLEYDYNYRYYFKFIFRADGSSKFNKDNRWGYFPSLSGAWRLDREDFIKDLGYVSTAKLRGGWGLSGNNRIGDFDSKTQLNINSGSGYVWGVGQNFVPGAFLSNIGVPDLKWETTSSFDIGLDFGFLDDRFIGTIDYYVKNTRDLLLNAEVSPHTGFERIQQNVGKVQNRGFELSLTSKNIDKDNFNWTTSFNISFNRNKTIALNNGQTEILTDPNWSREGTTEFQYITRVGQPVGMIYGLEFDGLYQAEDFVFNNGIQTSTLKEGIPDNGALPVAPGSVKFIDQNGDGTINEEDRVIIGNPQPVHTGGINNSFKIGNFDAQILFQWAYDFDVLNATRSVFTVPTARNSSGFPELMDAWTPTNTDTNINAVRYQSVFGRPPSGNLIDNRYVEDGSFLRLNTVALGYTFSEDALKFLRLKKLRLFLQGQNLYTWTSYKGYNPDVSTSKFGALAPNLDWSAYPQSVTILAGINITF